MKYAPSGYEFKIRKATVNVENTGTKVALCHPLELGGNTELVGKPWVSITPNSNPYAELSGELAQLVDMSKSYVEQILIYTTPSSKHAKVSLTDPKICFTLKYAGVGGNKFSIEIEKTTNLMKVYEADTLVESLKVATLAEVNHSQYVTVTGDNLDTLIDVPKTKFEGGVTAQLTAEEYAKYLTLVSDHDYIYLVTPLVEGNDSDVVTATLATELREQSIIATVVTHGDTCESGLPYVTTVYNGITCENGVVLKRHLFKLLYACISAGTLPHNSLVNRSLDDLGAKGLDNYYSRHQLNVAKAEGLVVLELRDACTEEVRIGSDTSNFRTTGQNNDSLLTNKACRTIDFIAKIVGDDFKDNKKGKVRATLDSASTYESEVRGWFSAWMKEGLIQNYIPEDVNIELTGWNEFTATLFVQPIDVLEKLVVELVLVQEVGGN